MPGPHGPSKFAEALEDQRKPLYLRAQLERRPALSDHPHIQKLGRYTVRPELDPKDESEWSEAQRSIARLLDLEPGESHTAWATVWLRGKHFRRREFLRFARQEWPGLFGEPRVHHARLADREVFLANLTLERPRNRLVRALRRLAGREKLGFALYERPADQLRATLRVNPESVEVQLFDVHHPLSRALLAWVFTRRFVRE
jgi:hypothetical protein